MSELEVSRGKIAAIHEELVSGIRAFMKEHGFTKLLLGLSGGVDSAVTCCLAKEAAGAENVLGLSMPSKYSADESREYAEKLAENLGVHFRVVPISGIYDAYLETLKEGLSVDHAEGVEVYLQNIQARIRGNLLMAFSNRFGHLVLATGNKSEAMMGYCTLYGDTVGGLAPLADVLKTTVYQLARHINEKSEVIPQHIIDRHPTAELKPGQKDQDSLPPYDVLDGILHCLEAGMKEADIVKKGHDPATVKEVVQTIARTEFKRRQVPPGIKLATRI